MIFFNCDFAFLIYLSDTNLDSGTKMYLSVDEDKETCLVNFVQNRFVMYDANLPHSAYGNYGKNLSDGRLTINGFNSYIWKTLMAIKIILILTAFD